LAKDTFPYAIQPEKLRWWPKRSRVEVSYDLSAYLTQISYWTSRTFGLKDAVFDLIAFNACDLNLNYIWVDYKQSINISREIYPGEVIQITHRLQSSDDCGVNGGCNGLAAENAEIQDLRVNDLPAKLIIYLWTEKPSANTDTPDLTYVINIR